MKTLFNVKLQARRELLRRKKVVKLQAAVRGHLVRNQAMGSLRCVQAIVKMQTLVRARHSAKDGSRVSAISVSFFEMSCQYHFDFSVLSADQCCFLFQDKAESNAAAQKLLENKFAKHVCTNSFSGLFMLFFYTHFSCVFDCIANGVNSKDEAYQD